jgi:hypothetical protein
MIHRSSFVKLSVSCRHVYVEQQMEKRLGVKKVDDRQQGPMDPEQALFVTPEELKVRHWRYTRPFRCITSLLLSAASLL